MITRKSYVCSLAGLVALAGVTVSGPVARAQGVEPAAALEEVTVTANRREQSANDVGVAVSVLGTDALVAGGIKRSEDIVNEMPNIEIT